METKRLNLFQDKKLYYILLLAGFLSLTFISSADPVGDDAVYSARAVGRLDFMFSKEQTTPLQWFAHTPWWSRLSYHDMPPLVLFIQHIFLSFRESIFFAKLPFVLMGLGAVLLTYLWTSRLYNQNVGRCASLLLALNALFIWTARHSFLEMGVIFFYSLAIYFFVRFLEDEKKFYLPLGISLGLLVLTKYTGLFLLPAIIGFILIQRRDLSRRKEVYLSFLISLLFLAPLIIYNLMMFKTTGHFDLQFSRLFGQDTQWRLSGVEGGVWQNFIGIWTVLGQTSSYLFLALSLAGIAFSVVFFKKYLFILLCLVFSIIFLIFSGTADRFLAPGIVFFVLPIALFYDWLSVKAKGRMPLFLKSAAALVVFYLLFFVINTHLVFSSSQSASGVLVGSARSVNLGVGQLDNFLDELIPREQISPGFDTYLQLKSKDRKLKKFIPSPLSATPSKLIVFDDNISWFSRVWLFERRAFYNGLPILSFTDYLSKFTDANGSRLKDVYFVIATDDGAIKEKSSRNDNAAKMKDFFTEQKINPEEVRRRDGKIAFEIYHWRAN